MHVSNLLYSLYNTTIGLIPFLSGALPTEFREP